MHHQLVADTKMPNTHKSDPECYNLTICFAKASTCVPKLTWIIEESFLRLKFHSCYTNMRLDLASSSFSFVGPATKSRLRIWSYPRDAGGSQRMVVWLAFSEHVLWFVDALAHLHLFIGIYSHSLLIGRIEWISGNDLCDIQFKSFSQGMIQGWLVLHWQFWVWRISPYQSISDSYYLPFGLFCFWQYWYSTVSHYVLYLHLIYFNYCRFSGNGFIQVHYLPPFSRNSALHLRCLSGVRRRSFRTPRPAEKMTPKRIGFLQLFFEGPGGSFREWFVYFRYKIQVFYQHILPFAATVSTMIEFPRFLM